MTYWLRVRRAGLLGGLSLLLGVVLATPAGARPLPVPQLLSGASLAVPLGLLAPLGLTIALTQSFTRADLRLEAVARRPLPTLDLLLCLGVVLVFTLSAGLAATALQAPVGVARAAGRNALGLTGIMLVTRVALPVHTAAIPPTVYALASSVLGGAGNGTAHWWAWPVAAATNLPALAQAVTWGVLGAALTLTRPVRTH